MNDNQLSKLRELIAYTFDAEFDHFVENCTCDEETLDKICDGESLSLCTCDDNKNHILRSADVLNDWLEGAE